MPLITENKRATFGAEALVVVDSDGADSLVYNSQGNQSLFITNNTGVSATLNIIGSTAPADYPCSGTGETNDLTGGYPVTIVDGGSVNIQLSSIKAWLPGDVTITGGATGVLYTLTAN